MIGEGFDEVLAAARRGDDWAWSAIYRDLQPVLVGFLRSQRAPHPEDLASEALLQVVRDLSAFEGDESAFRSWLFVVARNRTIDLKRYLARRPSITVDREEFSDRGSPEDDTEQIAIESATTTELGVLLEAVTPDQRDVLYLRYVANLTQAEVCEVLDKDINAVKQLQRRGLRALRRHLDAIEYPLAGFRTLSQS